MTRERKKKPSMLQSFNHAFQGLVYAVRHQRNMRLHLVVAAAVLVGSIFVDLTRTELLAILVAVGDHSQRQFAGQLEAGEFHRRYQVVLEILELA